MYTILSIIWLTTLLGIVYRSIFGVSRIRIIKWFITALSGGWALILLNIYVPWAVIPLLGVCTLIAGIIKKNYRILYLMLTWLIVSSALIPAAYQSSIIIGVIVAVLWEETIKASWIIVFNTQRLPYDGVLLGLVLWSYFGLFEASRAGWVIGTEALWMRTSTSLIVHAVATTSLLWRSMYSISDFNYRGVILGISSAIGLHSLYNLFQSSNIILIPLLLFCYLLMTYRISKIDRVYLRV